MNHLKENTFSKIRERKKNLLIARKKIFWKNVKNKLKDFKTAIIKIY